MSKKTRKKSPKSPVGAAARGTSRILPKGKASKSRASKPSKNTKNRQTRGSVGQTSHKSASKPLKAVRGTTKSTAAKSSPKNTGAPAFARSVLVEGTRAPEFRLPRDGGGTVSLSDYVGKKLALFFYPRADTPGCTREAIDFTRLAKAFAENNTSVLGVSADPLKAQEAFRDKHKLSVPLASDEQHQMLEAYGAWGEKSMYGRTFQGIIRTTVLIGPNGAIRKIWRNVRVDGHAEEVLAAARAA